MQMEVAGLHCETTSVHVGNTSRNLDLFCQFKTFQGQNLVYYISSDINKSNQDTIKTDFVTFEQQLTFNNRSKSNPPFKWCSMGTACSSTVLFVRSASVHNTCTSTVLLQVLDEKEVIESLPSSPVLHDFSYILNVILAIGHMFWNSWTFLWASIVAQVFDNTIW